MTLADIFNPWGWAILAAILAGIELLAPGIFLVWLGAAAAATALIVGVSGVNWTVQLMLFGATSIVSVALARYYFPYEPDSSDPDLNRRGNRLIGSEVTVVEAMENGCGRVQVGDSPWAARGPDLPAGARALVVAINGNTLEIEDIKRLPSDAG
jgi:membrane protein implicated in regulation of membrane protease activity